MAIGSVAGSYLSTVNRSYFEVPFDISPHKKIEPTVAVIIDPAGARGPTAAANTGLFRHVGKRAVTVIVIQIISTVSGYIKVRAAVVVIVTGGDSHTKPVPF